MGKRLFLFIVVAAIGAASLNAVEKAKQGAGSRSKAAAPRDSQSSGLYATAGAGACIPIGNPSTSVFGYGLFPRLSIGYRAAIGAGGFRIGVDSGCLMIETRDLPGIDRYALYFLPLGLNAGFDVPLAAPLYLHARGQGGYAPSLVFYEPPALRDLGIFRPYAGGSLGLGLALGKLSLELGASYLAIFYDGNAFSAITPELGLGIKF